VGGGQEEGGVAQKIIAIAIAAFLLNLPFGWIRPRYPKFSAGWFLCIHAPIPVVIFLRLSTKTPFKFVPIFVATAVAGQIAGSRLSKIKREEQR